MSSKSRNTVKIGEKAETNEPMLSLAKVLAGIGVYETWEESMSDKYGPMFGNVATIFTTHKKYKVGKLRRSDYDPSISSESDGEEDSDPEEEDGIELNITNRRELKMKAIDARNKEKRDLKQSYSKFFRAIYSHLATDSRLAVKADERFKSAERKQDPNILYYIIRETHFTRVHARNNGKKHKDVVDLRKRFAAFKQDQNTSIAEYKRMFVQMRDRLTELKEPPINKKQQAIMFLNGLDMARHGDMIADFDNGVKKYPKSLEKAYVTASTWRSKIRNTNTLSDSGSGVDHAFFLADDVPSHVFVVDEEEQEKDSRKRRLPRGTGGGGPAKKQALEQQKGFVERRKCKLCKQYGHLKYYCVKHVRNTDRKLTQQQLIAEARAEADKKKSEKEPRATFLAIGDFDEADDEAIDDRYVAMLAPQEEGDDDSVDRSEFVMAFSTTEVILDSAAGRSIFRDRELLRDL